MLIWQIDELHVNLSWVDLLIRRIVWKSAIVVFPLRFRRIPPLLKFIYINLFVELVFVDANRRNNLLVIETVYFWPLGLALEDGDSSTFVEVLLDELGDHIFFLFGGQPGCGVRFGASTYNLFGLCSNAILLRLLASTHHSQFLHVGYVLVESQVIIPEVYYLFGICQYLCHVFFLGSFFLLLDLVEDGFNQLLAFSTAELFCQQLCGSGIRIWRRNLTGSNRIGKFASKNSVGIRIDNHVPFSYSSSSGLLRRRKSS